MLHSQCEELVLHSLRWGVQHFHGSALMHINMAWMTVHFLRTAEAHASGPGQGAAVRVQGLSTAPLRHLHRAVSSLAWYEVDGWLLALRCTLKVRALLDATVAAGSSGERAAGLSSTAGTFQAFKGAAGSTMTPSSASVHGASMDGSTISSTLDDRNEGRQPTMRRVSPTSLHGFREALQAALSADEGAMRHLLAAWNAMADAEGTSAQATASAESFADLVAQAHVHYAAAVARNPESSTAYQYYGDFLANVVGLKAEAAFCTSRADALHRIAAQRQHAEQVLTVQDIQLGKVRHGVVPPSDDDELEPQLTLSGDVDAGFPIIAANAAAARMFGRHPHDVLGASVGALFPAAISGAVVRALGFAVSGIDVGAGAGARRPRKVGGMRTTPAGIALGQYQLWLGWHASRRCLVPMLMCISEHFGSATGADLAKLTVPQLEVSLREVRTSSALFLVDCAGVKSAPASDSGAAARRADGLLASTLSRFAACPVVGACEAGLALTGLGSRKTDFAAAQVTVSSVFKAAGPKGSTPKGQSLSDLGDDSRDLPRIDITHAVHGTTTPALARFTLAHLADGEEAGAGQTCALVSAVTRSVVGPPAPHLSMPPLQALVQHSGRSSQPDHDQGGGQALMSSTTLQSRAGGLPFHGMHGSRPHLRGADLLADSKAHPARQAEGSLQELSTDPHSLGQGMGRVSPTPHTLHDDCGPAPPANTGTAPHLAPAPRSQASSVTSSSHAMRGVASLRLSLLRVGADKQATEACRVWGTDTGQRARAVYRDVTLAKIVVGSLFFTLVSMIVLTSFGSSLDGALLVVLESLSTGLWAAGVRLLSSKLVTSAHSRMLTQATFLAEPEQLTLLELGALTADMDMAASAMRASDSRTADIIQAIIASRGIDTDAAYVPPANASEAAILSAFAENADSLAFPSDRMRWVPLSDAGSASVIMSTFEVGQWCAHMLRSITQLDSAAAFSNSSAVATYDAAMPDRVWPAFNASVRARAGMLQSFTGREYVEGSGSVDTLLFATLPLLCVVLGMSLMCTLAGTFSDDLLQPLLAVRSLQKPAMKQLQRRTIERLADIGARQGGSGRSADDGMELLLSDMEAEGDYSDVEAGDATFETDHVHLASTGMTPKPQPHRKLQAASVKDIPAAHGKLPAPDRHHARNAAGKRSGSQRALYKGGGMQYRQGACGLREGRLQCLGTGCCASLPFVLVMLSIMVLLTWVYVAGNGGVLMATSRLVLVQSAALQAVHFRMAVHDAVRGADAQAPGRAQAAQAAFLADMGHLLHGTAAGPMGTPLAPLPADDALMGLLVQDACLPPALARWQVNCSSAFNGVAATGGTLQVYLRLFSEGNQMLATLDEQGGFQAGANRYASSPRLQQGIVAMTSLEKGLARDAMRVAAATLKDQAVGTATGLTRSKNSSIAIGWLVLLAALVVQVRFLAAGGRRLVAVRSLLLQLPQDLLHNKTDALGAVVADCMSKHSKQAVQGKTWE